MNAIWKQERERGRDGNGIGGRDPRTNTRYERGQEQGQKREK